MICEAHRIIVMGHFDGEWSDWFDGLTITMVDNGETILSGPLADQTALHGVLIKIRDLGLPLLSLTHTEPEKGNQSNLLIHRKKRDALDEGCKKAHFSAKVFTFRGCATERRGSSCLILGVV